MWQNPQFLTPHRSAELLFRQKEERYVYIADYQLHSSEEWSWVLLFEKRGALLILLILNNVEINK